MSYISFREQQIKRSEGQDDMRQHGNNTHGNNAHGNNVDMTRGK